MMAIIETKTISKILGLREKDVRKRRIKLGVVECWCAVPVSGKEDTYYYYYSTYNAKDETVASNNPKKVMILGGRGMEVLSDKESLSEQAIETGKGFAKLGFKILAIEGTVLFYEKAGVSCEVIAKIGEGRPNVIDVIVNN